jgi:hypothetical protein
MEGAGLPLVLIGARPDAEYERLVRAHLPPGRTALVRTVLSRTCAWGLAARAVVATLSAAYMVTELVSLLRPNVRGA